MASHTRVRKSRKSRKSRRARLSRRTVSSGRRHCNVMLSRKVQKNLEEFMAGKAFYTSKQPIAVAYAQVLKKHPSCKRYYRPAGSRVGSKRRMSRKMSSRGAMSDWWNKVRGKKMGWHEASKRHFASRG